MELARKKLFNLVQRHAILSRTITLLKQLILLLHHCYTCWMIKRSTCDLCSLRANSTRDLCSFRANSNWTTVLKNFDAVLLLNDSSMFSTTSWMFIWNMKFESLVGSYNEFVSSGHLRQIEVVTITKSSSRYKNPKSSHSTWYRASITQKWFR